MKKIRFVVLATVLAMMLSMAATFETVKASTIPTFCITAVETDASVTVYTYNFPASKTFKVLMGEYGTLGIGGIEVAPLNSGTGGSFYGTFPIPEGLKGRQRIAIRIQGVDTPYYSYNWFWNNTTGSTPSPDKYTGIPTFSILEVNEDQDVTIKTNNFPGDMEFDVLMGKMWTKGINGIYITTINSGGGGAFEATFAIPAALKGLERISIRLQSSSGYYAYNWFWNNTTSGTPVPPPGYSGIPTFSILDVEEDLSVTIKTNNFPPDMEFDVLMGKMWTMGIGGIYVTTINSGAGGVFEAEFSIPAALHGDERIAIRLEAESGYFAYNWFWNNTTSGSPTPPSGYSGYPYFYIAAVVSDSSVTINAYNFPPNQDFDVLMGKMWTQGVNGTYVTTIDSGDGGNFTATYSIPAGLKGQERISIRLQSSSGYYAYNWFWNNTYP